MGEVSNGRVCVVGLGVRKVVGWGSVKWEGVCGRTGCTEGGGMGKCQMGGWCVVGLGVRKVVGWGSVKWEGVCGWTGCTEGGGMGEVSNGRGECGWTGCTEGGGMGKCQMGGCVWLDWVYGRWWDGEVSNGRVCVVGLGVRKVVGWGSVKWEGVCGRTGCTEGGGMGECQMGGGVWLDWVYGRWWDGEVSNGRVCVVGLGVRNVVVWGKCQMGGCVWLDWVYGRW